MSHYSISIDIDDLYSDWPVWLYSIEADDTIEVCVADLFEMSILIFIIIQCVSQYCVFILIGNRLVMCNDWLSEMMTLSDWPKCLCVA